MPKSSYQLGPIDAKEKATVEKILDIDIPRLQSEKGRSAMRWLVPRIRNKIGSTTGRAGCWNQMKSTFIGHVIYMQPKSITFKNLPATSSGTVLSPKLLWKNLPFFPRVSPDLSPEPWPRTLPATYPCGLAETHNMNSIQLFLAKKSIKINHPIAWKGVGIPQGMIFPPFFRRCQAFLLTKVLGLDLVKSHFVPRLKLLNMPWWSENPSIAGGWSQWWKCCHHYVKVSNCHAPTRNRFFTAGNSNKHRDIAVYVETLFTCKFQHPSCNGQCGQGGPQHGQLGWAFGLTDLYTNSPQRPWPVDG